MAVVGAVIAVVGMAISISASEEQANEEQRQATASARLKELQANEIMRRLNVNIDATKDEAAAVEAYGLARMGASGGESSGTLAFLTDTQIALRKQIFNLQSEANFNAFTLRQEASAQRRLGKMVQSAADYRTAGTVLQGGSQIANSFSSSSKSDATSLSSSSGNT